MPFCYYSLLGRVIDFPSRVRVVKKIPSTGRVARTRHSLPSISVKVVQEEGGVECLRAVEEIPAGVEITISYRSIIAILVTMRVRMKVTVRMTITM